MKRDRGNYNRVWYLAHHSEALKQAELYRLLHPEEVKEARKKWREKHQKEIKVYDKEYKLVHSEQQKTCEKEYCKTPKGQTVRKKGRIKFNLQHPEYAKKWWRSPKGKEVSGKHHADRRQLGFIPLNKPFPESRGHHIDKERVIYIPRKTHEENPHSVLRNRNMEAINRLAFDFLNGVMAL